MVQCPYVVRQSSNRLNSSPTDTHTHASSFPHACLDVWMGVLLICFALPTDTDVRPILAPQR